MTVRLAINPVTWVNDDMPSLGAGTSPDTILSETREAGFAGTEMSFQFPKAAAELGPMLKQHSLVLTSGWYDGRILERDIDAEWTAILPHMTLLRDLGCTYVVYADTSRRAEGDLFAPISRRPKLAEDEWAAYGNRLTALAERMVEFGVPMAFHHHMGTIIETDAEVDRLMAVTGTAVGLLYDTGHSVFSGGDPVALLKRNIKRVVHVHCKDARKDLLAKARAADASFMQSVLDGVFTVPGDGFIDYPTILKMLHDSGYAGWLVCEAEQDPRKAHPLTFARLGFSNLVRMALQAGFTVAP
ncbi:MAG: myo-inosose-2 dehydratase [Devosia sp.]